MVAALQALQRLSASRFASAEALVAAPAAGRLFAALSCGDDAVAAEAARLLTRLWAPAVRCAASSLEHSTLGLDGDCFALKFAFRCNIVKIFSNGGTCTQQHDIPMPIMHSILQAARAGLPPWRLTRAFTASEDEALAANSGDDNLTARAGGPTAFALRLPVGLVHGNLARREL